MGRVIHDLFENCLRNKKHISEIKLVMSLYRKLPNMPSAEEVVLTWFDAIKTTYAPIPMWGVVLEIEQEREPVAHPEPKKVKRELVTHSWDVATLANKGLEVGMNVVEKSDQRINKINMADIFKIASKRGDEVTIGR